MDVYEISGFGTGVSRAGVNYLQPKDSFQNIRNGFIYRQILQSRQGMSLFCPRLEDQSRVFGIFEYTLSTGLKELLAFDRNFMYKYNVGTRVFDEINFGGTMAAYVGFNISANDFYISGVSYPSGTNQSRFVFCGEGISANANGSSIFFYNGAEILDYTNVADNPDYVNPPQGTLTSSTYCLWFNERINFIVPVIAGNEYNQGVLFSGIRTVSGNGDNFNVAGSGLYQADTYQNITGVSILGQVVIVNFDRMVYTLEKTRDAFNPYFGRAVPTVLGTNAKFSAVAWDDSVKSLGKTGALGTDGRQNLRIDNKIPYFTRDEISQTEFNLTYGGFDRLNNQFLWSYRTATSFLEAITQDSILVYNYEESTWSTYDLRISVFGQTDIGNDLPWDSIDETSGNDSWAAWDTTEDLWDRIGIGQQFQKTLAGDNFGFIYELNTDFDDYFNSITAITEGATTTLATTPGAFIAGDLVVISNVQGMVELNNFDSATNMMTNDLYQVISATNTTIEINVDSSQFTPYTIGGDISKPIAFYAETIPFNPYREQGVRCFVSHVEFLLETTGAQMLVDVYADQQDTPFKKDVLIKPNSTAQSSEYVNMVVDQEANFLTFSLKQQSPAVQLKLTSMRIHCSPGGLTSG